MLRPDRQSSWPYHEPRPLGHGPQHLRPPLHHDPTHRLPYSGSRELQAVGEVRIPPAPEGPEPRGVALALQGPQERLEPAEVPPEPQQGPLALEGRLGPLPAALEQAVEPVVPALGLLPELLPVWPLLAA